MLVAQDHEVSDIMILVHGVCSLACYKEFLYRYLVLVIVQKTHVESPKSSGLDKRFAHVFDV